MSLKKQLHIIPIAALDMITMLVWLIWDLGPKDPLAYPRRGFSNTVPTALRLLLFLSTIYSVAIL